MNVGSSVSYRRAEGETTEWEDIQRKFGNLPELPKPEAEPEPEPEPAPSERLAGKTLDELDELGEDDAFADSRILDTYRERRIAELKALASKSRFGDVYQLVRADFVREVTEGSADCWVVVLLYSDSVMDSRRVEPLFSALARKHKATKFMRIEGRACIENYPDSNIPTILIYHKGEMQKRLITLGQMGGRDTNEEKLEWILFRAGAVESDLEGDPTLLAGREGPGIRASRMFLELERDGASGTRGRGGRGRGEDEDEDEDDRDVKARSSLRTAALRGELGRGGGGGGGGRRGRDDEEEEEG